jgi:DNA modification methylase
MRDAGWYLRSEVIWHKTTCLPEAVKDRPNRNHEHIFLFAKNREYYFDYKAIKEPTIGKATGVQKNHIEKKKIQASKEQAGVIGVGMNKLTNHSYVSDGTKYKRTVWSVGPSAKSEVEGHYATYSENLILPCVLSGSRVGGIVLDPFGGSGTTGAVAKKNDRKYILCELNEDWASQARERLNKLRVVKCIKKNDFFE